MARIEPFEKYPDRYDIWFENNKFVYQSEVKAIKEILPDFNKGIELGVGTARFAGPLNIQHGIDPSRRMRKEAKKKGIDVLPGTAEKIPFKNETFDLVFMSTALCFLDDVDRAFGEAYRILKKDGYFLNGFVDKNSKLGKVYEKHKDKNPFYKIAEFYSAIDVINHLKKTGFKNLCFRQTIFKPLDEISKLEPVRDGYGTGSFTVIRAQK